MNSGPDPRRRHGGPVALGAGLVGLFAGLTLWHTWPLGARLTTHMQAGADPKTMMWGLLDLGRNLVTDPLHLLDGSAFYPYSRTIAVVDHQFTSALFVGPLSLTGLSGVTLFNLVVLASFVLSGVFTALLVHRLTRSWEAAVVSGIGFAFATSRVAALPHAHVLSTQWLPLALWALHRFLDRPTWRRWLALATTSLLVALASWHGLVLGGIALAVVAIWAGARRSSASRLAGLAAVAVVCAVAVLPLASVYMEVAQRWPATREGAVPLENVARSAVQLGAPLVALPDRSASPLAAMLPRARGIFFPGVAITLLAFPMLGRVVTRSGARRLPGVLSGLLIASGLTAGLTILLSATGWLPALLELLRGIAPWAVFFGVAAVCSWWLARRLPDEGLVQSAAPYAVLAAAGAALALGPRVHLGGVDLGSGLWRLDLLGLPLLLRDPSRFGLLTGLAFAVLAGHTVALLRTRVSRASRVALVVAIVALLNVDLAFEMPELGRAPAPTGVDDWLRDQPADGAVVELPIHGNYWAIYASQEYYQRRNVDGRGFLRPPGVRALRATDAFDEQVQVLWEYSRPRYVVLRGALYEPEARRQVWAAIEELGPALELRARDGEDAVFELFDREVGDRITRRWPQGQLPDRDGLVVLTGRFESGIPGTAGILTAEFNGTVIGEWTAAEFRRRSESRLALPRQLYVQGENALVLTTRYGWLADRAANAVGTTGGVVRADVRVNASDRSAAVIVNGVLRRVLEPCWISLLDAESGELGNVATSSCTDNDPDLGAQLDLLAAGATGAVMVAIVRGGTQPTSPRLLGALADYGITALRDGRHAVAVGVRDAQADQVLVSSAEGNDAAEVSVGDARRLRIAIRRLEIR